MGFGLKILGGLGVFAAIGFIGQQVSGGAQSEKPATPAVKVVDFDWHKGASGLLATVHKVKLRNLTDQNLQNLTLWCEFSAASGTVVSSFHHVIYDKLPARTERTFRDIRLGLLSDQARKGGCVVSGAVKS